MQSLMLSRVNRASHKMNDLDDYGWECEISILAYGIRIGIRANEQEVLQQFLEQFPLLWKPAKTSVVNRLYSIISKGTQRSRSQRTYLAYANSIELIRTTDLEAVFYEIEQDLKFRLADVARRCVFVHAGVVGWEGKAIVIPGRCLTGKTTLVTELVRAGATYYSDEYAVFDTRGRVHPFPVRINARDKTGIHGLRYTAQSLGSKNGVEPLPVGTIIVSEFKAGASWQPQPLSTGQAILALMANTGTTRQQPTNVLSVLRQAASPAQALKGVRGEASAMINLLMQNHCNLVSSDQPYSFPKQERSDSYEGT